jgi:4-hydroxybenzoyl-CoA thioesterase/acyl-CoA thioester hydrolase
VIAPDEFRMQRTIEFADTDMGGIVHFARFFVFMETAEHRFLESLGLDLDADLAARGLGWPRVAASCEYRRPARFGDVLEVAVRVVRRGRSSVTYAIRFVRQGEEIATGRVTTACCELVPGLEVRAIPIPDDIAARIPAGTEPA